MCTIKAPAFEIDSMFTSSQSGDDVVECGNDSVNQVGNLPNPYVDTELLDWGNGWRVCTVGTHSTSNLTTWYLYWMWRSLEDLQINENPHIKLMLQPGERCSWCAEVYYLLSLAYCTCALGAYGSASDENNNNDDTWWQWIVDYDYNEAPDDEIEWERD